MSEEANDEVKNEPSLEDRVLATAKSGGWKEGGKNADGEELDAWEFVRRGSLFHRDLGYKLEDSDREVKKLYQVVAEHINTTKAKEVTAERAVIQAKIREAASEGNADQVMKLTDDLKSVKDPEPVERAADPKMKVVEAWYEDNKDWYENKDMRADALGFYAAEKERLGVDDPTVILPKVKARIEKEYQTYFKPHNANRDAPSGESGNGRVRKGASEGLTRGDLDEDERAHFDAFIKSGLKEKALLVSIAQLRARRGV